MDREELAKIRHENRAVVLASGEIERAELRFDAPGSSRGALVDEYLSE